MKEYFRKPYMSQGIKKHSDFMKAIPQRAVDVQGQIAPNIEFKKPYDYHPNSAQMIHYYANNLTYFGGDPVPPLNDPSLLPHAPSLEPEIIKEKVSFYPKVSGDDCTWWSAGLNFQATGSALILGPFGTSGDRTAIRFPSVSIPRGSKILSAFLTLCARTSLSGTTCSVNIYGNGVGNAVAPTTTATAQALALTGAVVPWSNLDAWVDTGFYISPNLKSIVSEITGKDSWDNGNALMLIIHDNASTVGAYRLAQAWDVGTASYYAKLTVDWEE